MNDAEAAQLIAENANLRDTVGRLEQELAAALQLITQLQARLEQPQQTPPSPPPFVKPNSPAAANKPPRRKRAAQHNNARQSQTPTEIRQLALSNCPDCGYKLRGCSIARKRQVLELPPPQPVTVIEYHLLKRFGPSCAKWHEPKFDLPQLARGQSRFSVRIMALVSWLRTMLRLPLRQIQTYLLTLHQLNVSVGEISRMLSVVAAAGADSAQAIKNKLQQSSALHMDETGWREDGQNGYIWVLSNAAGYSYYEYNKSRSGVVARGLSGSEFKGVLCSDFYGGYNEHSCRHQRCWAHLLRDLAELTQKNKSDQELIAWSAGVVELYRQGRKLVEQVPAASAGERAAMARRLERGAHELGLRWAQERGHPGQALSKRLLRHEGELFEFVRQLEVEATNNRAERALRPLVIARKISGGSRSEQGSATRMRLQTLFASWVGRRLDPLAACRAMLATKTPLPQV